MNCNHCQEQLLHYLYDVLEPEERAPIVQHLEGCAACQAAMDTLRAQQDLLAEAAKESFAEVTFQIPAETPKRFAAEPTQALPRRQRGFSWVRVAVAASIFVFVFGGGTMGVLGWFRTKDQIAVAEARVNESRKQQQDYQEGLKNHKTQTDQEILEIQAQIERIFNDWSKEANEQRKDLTKKTQVKMSAPSSPAAGAKIPVNIDVTNLQPALPAPAKMAEAKMAEAKGAVETTKKKTTTVMAPQGAGAKFIVQDQVTLKELYSQDVPNLQAKTNLHVPPLPITRDTKPEMRFEVFDKDGQLIAKHEIGLTAVEYLTHLMTDRPMYRPGELVRFRSLTLERFSLKPVQEDLHLIYRVLAPNGQEIFKIDGAATLPTAPLFDQPLQPQQQFLQQPQREPIKGPDGQPLRGLGAGDCPFAIDAPGGQYTLIVSEAQNRFPPEKRSFLVNQYQMPRMNKELKFNRSSYGPGDLVEINAVAKRAEGGVALAGQKAHVRAVVDRETVYDAPLTTNAEGKIVARFPLPAPNLVPFGQGSVTVEFHDGAGPETIVKPIPIVLNKLNVEFFAEGGDLIQGVSNRVYFQAKNTLGRPAELKGRVVDQQGNVVAKVETFHDDLEEGINQGQGSFAFVPVAGKSYELKIDTPIGIKSKHPLPKVEPKGIVLHLAKPMVDDTIDVEITSADTQRPLMIGAYCRGKLLDLRHIGAPAGRTVPVTLQTEPGVSGVYRITVYEVVVKGDDVQYVPRAERLTYRKNTEHLKVSLDGVKNEYFPGQRVELKLRAEDETKKRTPAIGMVSVVDLSLFKLADDKTERTMPTHFLLTNEIRKPEDFENADVLLGAHPKAAQALDLLLGTQGWRRFAEQDPLLFKEPEAARVVTAWAHTQRESAEDVGTAKVDKAYAVKAVKALEQLAAKEAVEQGPLDAPQQLHIMQINVEAANRARESAQASLRDYEKRMFQYLIGALVLGALAFGLGAIALGIRRMGQGRSALASLVTGTALLLFLFMGSLAGVFYMIGKRDDPMVALQKNADKMMEVAKAPAPPVAMVAPNAPAPQMLEKEAGIGGALPAPGGVGLEEKMDAKRVDDGKNERPAPAMRVQDDRNRVPAPALDKAMARGAPPPRFVQPGNAGMGGGAMPGGPPGGQQNPGGFGNVANGQPFNPNQALQQFGPQADAQFAGQFGGGGRGGANFNNVAERQLRQEGNYGEIMRRRLNRDIDLPAQLQPFYFREYAHKHAEPLDEVRGRGQQDVVRQDFTETVCWQPALILPGGEAQIAFDLSDSVTRYQVTVFSHSLDGRLGADRYEIAARLPFSIDPKVPFEISNTDKVIIPVAVKNDTKNEARVELSAKATGLKTQDPQARNVVVGANERNRGFFAYESAVVSGKAKLRVTGTMNFNQLGSDTVEREFKIVAEGFPMKGSASGLLERAAAHDLPLPNAWVASTLQCQVQVFPSTLAELQKGLEGLLREPCGCFEQSSSSNYPNVLILNYLQEAGQADPSLEQRARGLMQSGYQKLTSFECVDPKDTNKRGYEWFGQTAPPHEALTAYGLLQFRDMARIYKVDQAMVERTRTYLLGQRDGQGGFKRNARAIDTFGRAPAHITNAYIVWALTDGGQEDLSKEMAALFAKAKDSKDPYFLALVALGHLGGGKTDEALTLAKALKDSQKDDGHLQGTETSITGSQGRDLQLETTALAVLAWLKANRPEEFHANVEKAVKWISAQRSGQGSFGATQSTILALKALIAHTRDAKKIAEDGKLSVKLGDRLIAETSYTAGASEPITLALAEGKGGLQPGKNKVLIETTGKNTFPYTLSWSYQTLTPPSDTGCPVKLSARLGKLTAQEGDTVKLLATVENLVDKGHGMTIAILGLPAGLSIPEDAKQLKDLARLRDNDTKPGVISHWELRGRELVLYWRDLAPKAKIDVEVDLICRLPGTYRGPASRAYLYYNADHKNWIEPLGIVIDPQRAD